MYSVRQEKLLELLKLFAQNKELYQNEIKDKLKTSYRTVIRLLQHLEKEKFVELARIESSGKQGRGNFVWKITFKGLWLYLCDTKLDNQQLEQIISRFPNMLLFFRKWPLFVEAGVKEKVLESFVYCLRMSWNRYYDVIRVFASAKPSEKDYYGFEEALLEEQKNYLNISMFVGLLYMPGLKEVLLPYYMKDREITAFVRSVIERKEKEYVLLEELREFLKS